MDRVETELETVLGVGIERLSPFDVGVNDVYYLRTSDGDEYVAKYGSFDATSVRAEPFLMTEFQQRTAIPVPDIVYMDTAAIPPFFVMEYLDGNQPQHAHEVPLSRVTHLAADLGRILGELQSLSVAGAGQLVYDESSASVECNGVRFEDTFRAVLDEFETQARHNYPEIPVDTSQYEVPEPNEATYCPLDLHTQNLLYEGEGLVGVIDFERVYTGHPRWGYENTLYMLTVTRSDRETAAIEAAFETGYASVRPPPEPFPVFTVAAVLREMRAAHIWWNDPDEHRTRIQTSLEGLGAIS